MFFDTHLHLDLFAKPKEIIKFIESQKYYSIAVTNLPQVFMKTKELCEGSKYIRPALGFHPELVYKFKDQFELFEELLDETRYVGEIGIDNLRKTSEDFNCQKLIFEKIIRACAEKKDKILSIHSRCAEKEAISIIGNRFPGKAILHWYSGSISELNKAVSFGFYFSINSSMTQSKNGVNIIRSIPNDRLLLESDSPFIGVNRESIVPVDMSLMVNEIAAIKRLSIVDFEIILKKNFKNLIL